MAISGVSVALTDGKYCPHCRALSPHAPSREYYEESLQRAASDKSEEAEAPRKKQIDCNYGLESRCMDFLKRHAEVHTRQDWARCKGDPRGVSFSARYLLAYSALKEFSLAGTLSVFNGAIGPLALASKETSKETLKFLCDLVAGETGETLPLEQFAVEAFAISNGSCVVVTFPPPKAAPEPYMVGIATDANLETATSAKPNDKQTIAHYFSLELTHDGPPIVCGWQLLGGSHRRNYQLRADPDVSRFVQAIERLWTSGEYRF
jgi:hypothetical protein